MAFPTPVPFARLEEFAATHDTPYYLIDEAGIRNTVKGLLAAFQSEFGPTCSNFYAVKALPNPAVLAVVVQEGCGLDCSSASELHVARVRVCRCCRAEQGTVNLCVAGVGRSRPPCDVHLQLHQRR